MSYWRKRNSSEESGGGTGTNLSDSTPEVEKRPTPSRTNPNSPSARVADMPAEGDGSLEIAGSEQLEDLILKRFGKPRSALGPGTVVQGKLAFDTPVRIDGQLSGDIHSSRAVIVGRSGYVEARIEAAELIVFGHVRSEMVKTQRLEILGGGCVEATVESGALVVEQGSTLRGSCTMGAKASIELSSGVTGMSESASHHTANAVERGKEKAAKQNSDSEIVLAGSKGGKDSAKDKINSELPGEIEVGETLVDDATPIQVEAATVS